MTVSRLTLFAKARSPIETICAGIVTVARPEQFEKAYPGIDRIPAPKIISDRLEFAWKAPSPRDVTLSGITTLARFVELKASVPIETTLSGMIISVRLKHPLKQFAGISFNPDGR